MTEPRILAGPYGYYAAWCRSDCFRPDVYGPRRDTSSEAAADLDRWDGYLAGGFSAACHLHRSD